MVAQYILIVLFTVLAFVFLAGKGGWFIAGYNTMSDEDRQKCIAVDILLIISCIIGERATDNAKNIFAVLGIVIAILTVILANTICRKK